MRGGEGRGGEGRGEGGHGGEGRGGWGGPDTTMKMLAESLHACPHIVSLIGGKQEVERSGG